METIEHDDKTDQIVPDNEENQLWQQIVRHLPVEEDHYILLYFYDTYIYYYVQITVAFYSSNPTPF